MDMLFLLLWSTLLLLLLIASITDWRKGIIPNSLILVGAVLGIAEHVIFQGIMSGLMISLVGGAMWFAIGWLFWSIGKFGGGDVKLFAMIATFTGVSGIPDILMVALVAQLIVFLIEFGRGHMSIRKPFASAIAAGSLALMLWQVVSMKGGL